MESTSPYSTRFGFWRRVGAASVPLALGAYLAVAAPSPATAAGGRPALRAVSSGVLTALSFHQGQVVPRGATAPDVTILPNVRVSHQGSQPVNEVPITANPQSSMKLESGGNDYNCGSVQGFYNSDNGGSTWPHQHCLPVFSGKEGFGDPNVVYDATGNAYILGIEATGSLTNGEIVFQKSVNNGVTWGPLSHGPKAFYAHGLTDKAWTEADQTLTSPFAGCLYTSITQFDTTFTKETIT